MKVEFNFSEATEFMVALDHYKGLSNYLNQLDSTQRDREINFIYKNRNRR